MAFPISTCIDMYLDRFEERMQLDSEQLKRQLIAQVDERFKVFREKVAQLRCKFGCCGQSHTRPEVMELPNTVLVENVSYEQWHEERRAEAQLQQPFTSTGRKRKSSNTSRTVNNKRHKTVTTHGPNKHQCKSPGCGKSFRAPEELARHERIHLGIKPYSCTWPDCKYASQQRPAVVTHIRTVHFKLPSSFKEQIELNIFDDRDPNEFVRVDQQLANRRL